jgi:hypothetical protein
MEEGRGHRADGFYEGFLDLFAKAEQIFRETSQLENAAFCLEEMSHLEEAGGNYKPPRRDFASTDRFRYVGYDRTTEEGGLPIHAVRIVAESI